MKHILVTGGAGFIGGCLIDRLIEDPTVHVTCVDNLDSFYDPKVKKDTVASHRQRKNYTFVHVDIRNFALLQVKLARHYDIIIHLAAKVGVGPSMKDPVSYATVNISGMQNMLEFARRSACKKFIFGSSSSVYGRNPRVPWREDDYELLPMSPYAATKISGEALGRVYASMHNFQFIGLRFFTVYGRRMRPDLAIHKFTKLIMEGRPIPVYGDGTTKRDYTYIDDAVTAIMAAIGYWGSPYEIVNVGNNKPVTLRTLVSLLEKTLGKKAKVVHLPEQPGDVRITYANISKAQKLLGYEPKTNLRDGVKKFVRWFQKQK